MKYSIPALVLAIIGGAFGQLFLKAGLLKSGMEGELVFLALFTQSFNVLLLLSAGMIFYGASMFAWIISLRHFELSFAYPLLSIGYLIVYAGALAWPGMTDTFSLQKVLGILLIIFGVTISAQKTSPCLRVRHGIPEES